MVLALILILLAIVLFGVGIALKLAWWILVLAVILGIAGAIAGYRSRTQL